MIEIHSVYHVKYFRDEVARQEFRYTIDEFVDDRNGALRHAATLGRANRWVKVISKNFADTDTHIAAFGTDVTHEPDWTRGDRRGEFRCQCGAWLTDEAALIAHQDLAGVKVCCQRCDKRIFKYRDRWWSPDKDDWCPDNEAPHYPHVVTL